MVRPISDEQAQKLIQDKTRELRGYRMRLMKSESYFEIKQLKERCEEAVKYLKAKGVKEEEIDTIGNEKLRRL